MSCSVDCRKRRVEQYQTLARYQCRPQRAWGSETHSTPRTKTFHLRRKTKNFRRMARKSQTNTRNVSSRWILLRRLVFSPSFSILLWDSQNESFQRPIILEIHDRVIQARAIKSDASIVTEAWEIGKKLMTLGPNMRNGFRNAALSPSSVDKTL